MSNYELIDNYIYLYHLDKFLLLPTYPEQISDSNSASYSTNNPLSRSAPIFAYSYSGPRTVQINLTLHRDLMTQLNYSTSNVNLNEVELGDDYVDFLAKAIQTIVIPKYSSTSKMVNPPMVALRFGNEIYVKGVVTGGVTVTYRGPILNDNKYAIVDISFTVSEVDPYDAESIMTQGSFRGLSRTLERRIYKK